MQRILILLVVLLGLLGLATAATASGGGNLYLVQVPSAPEKIVWTDTAGEWRNTINGYGNETGQQVTIEVNTMSTSANGLFHTLVRDGNDENLEILAMKEGGQGGYVSVSGSEFAGLTVGHPFAPQLSDGVGVDVHGKLLRLRQSKTPASASAACNQGELGWDANFVYVCVSQNQWRRAGLAGW